MTTHKSLPDLHAIGFRVYATFYGDGFAFVWLSSKSPSGKHEHGPTRQTACEAWQDADDAYRAYQEEHV